MCWDLFSLTNPVGSILVSATTSCKWPVYILHFGQPLTGNTTATLNRELQWTATAAKTSLQKWIRTASNFIALISSMSIGQNNVGSFFWSWILKNCIEVQEEEKKVVVAFSCRFHVVVVQWRQCNVPKSVMHAQSCCFANTNLLLLSWSFSLKSPSSLLKFRNIVLVGVAINVYKFVSSSKLSQKFPPSFLARPSRTGASKLNFPCPIVC